MMLSNLNFKVSVDTPPPPSPHCFSTDLHFSYMSFKHLRTDSLHGRLALLPKILYLNHLIQSREEKRLKKCITCMYTHAQFFDVGTELLHSGSPLQQLCRWWVHHHTAVAMCLFCTTLPLLDQHSRGNPGTHLYHCWPEGWLKAF